MRYVLEAGDQADSVLHLSVPAVAGREEHSQGAGFAARGSILKAISLPLKRLVQNIDEQNQQAADQEDSDHQKR